MFGLFKRKNEQAEPQQERREPYLKTARRGYSAAQIDRLTAGWIGTFDSKNQQIEYGSPTIRRRARDLANNNDYVRKYLNMVKANVIGTNGISLQCKIVTRNGKPDERANRIVERRWKQWTQWGNCTIDAHMSWVDVQNILIETAPRDGEALVLMIVDRQTRSLRLQLVDIDRLESSFSDHNRNIRQSIEYNDRREPIAYHILTKHPSEHYGHIQFHRERYTADQVLHLYRPEQPEQERGVSWLASAMTRLNMLAGYEEAELVAARLGASKMGFYTSPDGEGYVADTKQDDMLLSEAEPGMFEQLPDGIQFTPFDPQHPAGNFQPFMKTMLRGIASGLGVSYNGLASDLEGVNFSSIRSGVIDERDHWRTLQRWVYENAHHRIFKKWLEAELLFGNLEGYDIRDHEKLSKATWQPRGWAWVDPQKDINASITAINEGLKTRSDVVAESGKTIEEVFEQLQKERELMEKYGLTEKDNAE